MGCTGKSYHGLHAYGGSSDYLVDKDNFCVRMPGDQMGCLAGKRRQFHQERMYQLNQFRTFGDNGSDAGKFEA